MTKIRIMVTLLVIAMLASLIMGCKDNTQQVAEALPTFEELVAINGYDEVFKNHATIYLKNTCIDSDPSESFVQEAVLMPGDGKVEYHMTATNIETNTVVRELSRIGDEWYYYDIDEGIWAILEVGNSVILDISTPRLFEDAAPMGKAYVDGDYVVHHAYTIYEAWEDIDALRYDYTYYFNKDTYLLEKVEIKHYDGAHVLTKTENVEFKYDVNVSDVFESTLLDRMHASENRIDIEIIADYNTDNEKKYNIVATTDSLLYAAVLNDITYVVYSDPECQNEILDLSEYEGTKSVTFYATKFVFEEVRNTVTEEEWNAWTTYKNYTIEQYYGNEHLIHKYNDDAFQFENGDIILFLEDKQYKLYETDEGYVAHDVTSLEFANDGLLSGGYVYDEFVYDEELGAYVLDLVAEMGMYWEVKFEDGVPVSIIYNEFTDDGGVFSIISYYTNVGTTVIDIPDYIFEEDVEDTTRKTVTEEEWDLNLNAGSYAGALVNLVDGEFLEYSYKCTNNAIELEGMLIVYEGDKTYQLQESAGVWYAFELEEGAGIPTMVPQGLKFSDYEYDEENNIYVPKNKEGAELYYSFSFVEGVLRYGLLQTTLDESNPEYYEFISFNITEIGTVEIEIPEYVIYE